MINSEWSLFFQLHAVPLQECSPGELREAQDWAVMYGSLTKNSFFSLNGLSDSQMLFRRGSD